ncbi:uncharacterized protein RJT20DRAFT_123905 [Scheffersomyces xylosifermentans]|uniref:uncharacterized protein n=1 Tax=Scheffersomyces xylosifermentans TaxID=1304137 RepID=UPI00315D4996
MKYNSFVRHQPNEMIARVTPIIRRQCTNAVRHYSVKERPSFGRKLVPLLDALPKEVEKEAQEKFVRLSKAFELLRSKRGFASSVAHIDQIYRNSGRFFIQEVLYLPDTNIYAFLFHHYKNSASIRTLILEGLFNLIIRGEIVSALYIVEKMQSFGIMSMGSQITLSETIQSMDRNILESEKQHYQEKLANLLLFQTILSGHSLLASSFLTQCIKENIKIESITVNKIISSLICQSDSNHLYYCHTIHRLLDHYGTEILTQQNAIGLMTFMQQNPHAIFYVNMLFNRFENKQELYKNEPKQYIRAATSLIRYNIDNGLHEVALKMWVNLTTMSITPLDGTEQLETTAKLIKCAPDMASVETIAQLLSPEIIEHIEVLEILLEKYGTSKESIKKFESLLKLLKAPLRRSTLTALFKSYVYQDNEKLAEKILQSLFKSKDGATAEEMNAVFTKLLRQGKLEECIDMVKSTDIHIAKRAYITIFREILQDEIRNDKERKFLQSMCSRLLLVPKEDEVFQLLTIEIIRYFSKKINNRAAKKTYIAINNLVSQSDISKSDKGSQQFNLEKFRIPNKFKDLLNLNNHSRIQCLDIISQRALQEKDTDTVIWSVDEYRFLGLTVKEIIQHIKKVDKDDFLSAILKEDIYESCN